MGLKLLAPLVAAVALATPSAYLQSQQQADGSWGGFTRLAVGHEA